MAFATATQTAATKLRKPLDAAVFDAEADYAASLEGRDVRPAAVADYDSDKARDVALALLEAAAVTADRLSDLWGHSIRLDRRELALSLWETLDSEGLHGDLSSLIKAHVFREAA